ncbi:MAG TPA: ATP synthase F1 subunit gamma [Phycisphaerae bacterium]|nr:ATP synthase F1 subunit gamma [Phycisphaerae bacterium]
MANPRVLVKRRKAVRNIRKITRTMQLIATARFQQTMARATASRPYAERITELVQELGGAGGRVEHPLLADNPQADRSALLVVTSNRGLCGGYNSNLLRAANEHLAGHESVDLHMVGKKGVAYFRFLGRPMARTVADFPDMPKFADVEPMAEEFMAQYRAGRYSAVHVVHMRYLSVASQVPACIQLLPVRREATAEPEPAAEAETQYDFSPPPAELLAELLPATVKVRLFQCFTDATVSEQVARMVAMKAATDAADDMIKLLSRHYNRARQSQITSELLDIIGGAEALK